jgi:hypothetical protein
VNEPHALEQPAAQPELGQVVQNQLVAVAQNDLFDHSPPVDQQAELASQLVRQFGTGPGELRGNEPVDRHPPAIQMFQTQQLAGLEPMGVAENGWNRMPPV